MCLPCRVSSIQYKLHPKCVFFPWLYIVFHHEFYELPLPQSEATMVSFCPWGVLPVGLIGFPKAVIWVLEFPQRDTVGVCVACVASRLGKCIFPLKKEEKNLHGAVPVKMNIAVITNVLTTCYGAGMEGNDINSLMEIVENEWGTYFWNWEGPHKDADAPYNSWTKLKAPNKIKCPSLNLHRYLFILVKLMNFILSATQQRRRTSLISDELSPVHCQKFWTYLS